MKKFFRFAVFIACALIATTASAQALNVYATGQSGMVAVGVGGPSPTTADSRVKVWNNDGIVTDGDALISPPALGNPPWHSGGGNNPAVWFADAAAVNLGTDVNLVVVAKGSQSITKWESAGPMYQASKRIYQLTGLPPADVMLWHQGETDKNMGTCEYRLRLSNLIAQLKGEGIIAHDAYILLGELRYDDAEDISEAMEQMAVVRPDIGFVHIDNLPDYDGIHLTGSANPQFGVRYFEEYQDYLGM
jgi:hypothetical protein